MSDDKTRKRQQDPPSELTTAKKRKFVSNEDIQFGTAGAHFRITNDGLGAEVHENGVVYGVHPLQGRAEFEVKIVKYPGNCGFEFGVMRYKKSAFAKLSFNAVDHRVWCSWYGQKLLNNLVTPYEVSDYGNVDLDDLSEGDRVGLCLSENGVLEFFVNGENQGIAARDIYTRNSDVYAHLEICYHRSIMVATVITKAGEMI